MYMLRKIFIYILIILLFLSIYQDFTTGFTTNYHPKTRFDEYSYTITPIKVMPGETVLSILESLNGDNMYDMEINEIMDDFKEMNPNADPYELKPATVYYFPIYKK